MFGVVPEAEATKRAWLKDEAGRSLTAYSRCDSTRVTRHVLLCPAGCLGDSLSEQENLTISLVGREHMLLRHTRTITRLGRQTRTEQNVINKYTISTKIAGGTECAPQHIGSQKVTQPADMRR